MFIAALLVGLLVAYYFGVRPAAIAAGATSALFLVAVILPSLAVYAYVLVGAGVVGIMWLGPKRKRAGAADDTARLRRTAFAALRTARRTVKKFLGNDKDVNRRI